MADTEVSDEFAQILSEVVADEEFRAYRSHASELTDRVISRNGPTIVEEVDRVDREADARVESLSRARQVAGRERSFASWGASGLLLVVVVSGIAALGFSRLVPVWISLGVGLFALAGLISFVIRGIRSARLLVRLKREQVAQRRLNAILVRDTLRTSLSAAYSSAIADLLKESGLIDFPRVAPRLVELDVESIVPVRSIERVERFIFDHPTSAIGITGPRGAGKSTLLRAVCDRVTERGGSAVLLPSPVEHDLVDLLRSIAVALRGDRVRFAREERARINARHRWRTRTIETLGILALIYAGAILIVLGSVFPGRDLIAWTAQHWPVLVGLTLLVGAAGLFLKRLARRQRALLRLRGGGADQILDDVIESLTYEVEAGASLGATLSGGGVEIGGEVSRNRTSREVTHAQLSSALKDALRSLGSETPGPFLLAIDELDKLPNREALLGTVNAIKDLLHLRNVHVAVSLSDEALGAFELRETSQRDAFDSTFDTIIDVDRLEAIEAVAVIDSRVTGFPPQLGLLCYVWAGGLPRDLLRHARACVEYVKDLSDVPAWHAVGFGVIKLETRRKIEAAIRAGSPASGLSHLRRLTTEWEQRRPDRTDFEFIDNLDETSRRLYEYTALRFAANWMLMSSERGNLHNNVHLETLRHAVVMTASSGDSDEICDVLDITLPEHAQPSTSTE